MGSFEIIAESNRQLQTLEKELKHFKIQKGDLRFSLYSMIIAMLQNNIRMRLWVNDLMTNQIEESKRRIDTDSQKLGGDMIAAGDKGFVDLDDEYATAKPKRNRNGVGQTRQDDDHVTEGYSAKEAFKEREMQRDINKHEKRKSPLSHASSILGATKTKSQNDQKGRREGGANEERKEPQRKHQQQIESEDDESHAMSGSAKRSRKVNDSGDTRSNKKANRTPGY